MTLAIPFPTTVFPPLLAPLFFARRTNHRRHKDLFEDFDDDAFDPGAGRGHRPRRPFFTFVMAALLIAGTWYVATDPDLRSSITTFVEETTGLQLPVGDGAVTRLGDTGFSPSLNGPPIPLFREGQRVNVTLDGGARIRLRSSHDAEATRRGPSVKSGDVITVLDGRLVNRRWVYHAQTTSGASGWIHEERLEARL